VYLRQDRCTDSNWATLVCFGKSINRKVVLVGQIKSILPPQLNVAISTAEAPLIDSTADLYTAT
jgi:hypothetical protein